MNIHMWLMYTVYTVLYLELISYHVTSFQHSNKLIPNLWYNLCIVALLLKMIMNLST